MAIMITDECINCGACEPECPNNAIYEGGVEWAISDGTSVTGPYKLEDGSEVDAGHQNEPVSDEFYYISPDKCTECIGFHEEPPLAMHAIGLLDTGDIFVRAQQPHHVGAAQDQGLAVTPAVHRPPSAPGASC